MDRSLTYSVSYMFLIFLPGTFCGQVTSACRLTKLRIPYEYEYYKEGDVIIGGLIAAHFDSAYIEYFSYDKCLPYYCVDIQLEQYKNILAFIFAIDEINKDPDLLPNVTLGYRIFDTCGNPRKSLKSAIQIMSGKDKEAPNYSCVDHGEVAAFVTNSGFYTNSALIQFLSLYKFTQINFGPADPLLSDRVLYPTLYQITPDDRFRYSAIIKCLQYFGWNWVGIITQDTGIAEMELVELRRLMTQHGICIDFIIELLTDDDDLNKMRLAKIGKSRTEVIVICGLYHLRYPDLINMANMENITLILHESWINILYLGTMFHQSVNCSLIFRLSRTRILNVNIIENVNPLSRPDDPLLEELWYIIFGCLTKNKEKNKLLQQIYYQEHLENCTDIYDLPKPIHKVNYLYYVYKSVEILAHVLSRILLRRTSLWKDGIRQEISKYMKHVNYVDESDAFIHFTERGGMPSEWDLVHLLIQRKENQRIMRIARLATFEDFPQEETVLAIDQREIVWKNDRKPQARCNDPCSPGYRKAPNGGYQSCCYNCAPCSQGEVSNITDSEICHKCPEEEWPDEKKVKCLPKTYVFLSYEEDIISFVFLGIVLFLCAVTLFILRCFISYWDTPIVKANNRTVSFILLVSILLSFLSIFFFLSRPVDITCLLRQISFGIFFSIGVSSVLAKTITVCIAFKSTKPGSVWGKWISISVSHYVVFICSSVQVLICVIWLLVSPPYVEFDHHSYPGKIIIQCNEGSDICFYSMLGYLGLLAAVSFVLAFMVRTLPDSFNEAKYITFSMLLFCSVWIAMIPAYLSTRGKYMVVVEIFAILTSCAGILGCIFLPKIYILLLKPNLNFRKIILEKNKI